MSVTGRPDAAVSSAPGLRVGIAAARWNADVVEPMLHRARAAVEKAGAAEPTVVRVAGCVELPVIAQELARTHDAVVALGAVVRGGTPHFDYVCLAVTQGLTEAALRTETPVASGVLTCDNQEQALARAGLEDSIEDKGWESAAAAIESALALRSLRT
ncbi:6,7-dimethyl-8-ribityllumazine synthase [Nocardiopsis coralliicola]